MKKKIFFSLVFTMVGFGLFAGGSTEKSTSTEKKFSGETLNVIATSKYQKVFDAFSAKTGAKVEFLTMSSGTALNKIRAEGKTSADIWFGGGIDAFMAAKEEGLLQNYISPNAKDIPAQYKDKDGAWIAKGITVVGFIGNKSVLKEKNLPMPKTWAELANPKYKGEVSMANPANSGTIYGCVKGILDLMGEKKGWEYFTKLNKNIPFLEKRGKGPQEKVKMGEFAVGVIPADKKAFDLEEDYGLVVVYPEDGIPWVPEGTAIFKGCQNLDLAKAFMDFMLTKEALQIIAEIEGKDSNQIIKPGVKGFELGLPVEKLIKEDLTTFGSMRKAITEKFNAIHKAK